MSNRPSPQAQEVLGRLYLVPAPLDFGCEPQADLQDSLPLGTIQVAARLTHWICENAKTTRAYLKRVGQQVPLLLPLQSLVLQELPRDGYKKGEATGQFDARALLAPALIGQDMGLVSEAGMPAVADPGAAVVRAAHDLGLVVVPLVGPVSLLAGVFLCRLPAAGLKRANAAHWRDRIIGVKNWPNPDLHRDPLPKCRHVAGTAQNPAAQHPAVSVQRPDTGQRPVPQPHGQVLAHAKPGAGEKHTRCLCTGPVRPSRA